MDMDFDGILEVLEALADDLDRLQIILLGLAICLAAIIAIIVVFGIILLFRRDQEQGMFLSLLLPDIRLNLDIAKEIVEINAEVNSDVADDSSWQGCEIIPMSESVWIAVVSSGGLLHIDKQIIPHLSQTYANIQRANSFATYIQLGAYDRSQGKQYIEHVKVAVDGLETSLQLLTHHTK